MSSFAGTERDSWRGLDAAKNGGTEKGTNGIVMERKGCAPDDLDLIVYIWHAMLCSITVSKIL